MAEELYDHETDPLETRNIVQQPQLQGITKDHATLINEQFGR